MSSVASERPRVVYLDSSAIVKLVVRERETDALEEYLGDAELVSSEIADVEVPRAAYLRTGKTESVTRADAVLRRLSLVPLDDELRRSAARARPAELRSLDAVHLVSCLRVAARLDSVVCYDRRLAVALGVGGLRVEAPTTAR